MGKGGQFDPRVAFPKMYLSEIESEILFFGVLLNPLTTDQPTTNHLLTNSPINRPPTHRPVNYQTNQQDSISKTLFYK